MAEMYRWADLGNPFGKMSGGKAVLIVGFIAALLYYLIVIRRLGRRR